MQTWFITGASSGLGAAIAEAALGAGHRVAATARDSARLRRLVAAHPKSMLALSMDLTKPSEIMAAIADAEDWQGGIDVLVNNAAIGYVAAIEEGEEDKIRRLFDTNFFGVASTIRAALPGMRAKRSGTIINVSSLNGLVAMPALGYYSATKFALEALNDALHQEVSPLGIKVMSIEPGGVRTGIIERNLRSPRIDAYGPTAHAIIDLLESDRQGVYAPSDPHRIADVLIRLVESGDLPLRLSLGADSWSAIMAKLESLSSDYEKFKDVSNSTYFR
ncbi:SDR family NAD(P)-dependent oxidoreductase [Rhizobium sp. Root1220]|uniref:SDR family NAD(P)-dependent oxidoreductase n=1 Tax=Rhizobium sp. Root1220 TaxID=1736432 RepID=UPI0006FE5138|nr:SDR family NAD(P)-dependent oxidoreductase [Rhizobium sp. Root1220]KQV78125.1 hypothetical protein ASC90_27090 [Rhizobium sp. Root1220]